MNKENITLKIEAREQAINRLYSKLAPALIMNKAFAGAYMFLIDRQELKIIKLKRRLEKHVKKREK